MLRTDSPIDSPDGGDPGPGDGPGGPGGGERGGPPQTLQAGNGDDTITLSASNDHVEVGLNGTTVLDVVGSDALFLRPLAGGDRVVIDNLSGTSVTTVAVDLTNSLGNPDGAIDQVVVNGSSQGDEVVLSASADGHSLTVTDAGAGAFQTTLVTGAESIDNLFFQGGNGNDTVSVAGISSPRIFVSGGGGNDLLISGRGAVMNGGAGDDTIQGASLDVLQGGDGNDVISAGDSSRVDAGIGNDTITMGSFANGVSIVAGDGNDSMSGTAGNVTFNGGAGDDSFSWNMSGQQNNDVTVDGGADNDHLVVSGPQDASPWTTSLTNVGGIDQLHLQHTIGSAVINTTIHVTNTETIDIQGGQAADSLTIGDQSGTGVKFIHLDLGSINSGPDGRQDVVTLNATSGGDAIQVTNPVNGSMTVSGLPETVQIDHLDVGVISDRVVINAGAGNDTITLTSFNNGLPHAQVIVDGGAGDNTVRGGDAGFVYDVHAGSGSHDTFFNFEGAAVGGHDQIDISSLVSATGDHTVSDLIQHGHLVQQTSGALLTDGHGTTLFLDGMSIDSFRSADFLWGP